MQPGIARQRTRGLAADPELRRPVWASMVSFMAVVTLTSQPLWYTVSIQVVLATQPPMTASAGCARTAPGIQSFGAAFENFDFCAARGEKGHKQVVHRPIH